ncbi:purple acid phosphatase family protein [Corynebacterium confusum]|uniref:purple acid phosphatase family protein n=1 Tax=Corynebacterium confusum TaxID=71254 RepID=UPI0025B55BAF|nr:metallophosphoesterase family protein [Corynebacterium confusum]WJY90737.1 Calcineurin-like phosphoesterase [Corynebacterium confusum]
MIKARLNRSFVALGCALSVTLASGAVVPTTAQAQESPIYRQVLQPGADETSVIVSWRTNHRGEEKLKVYPTGQEDQAKEFDAKEKNAGRILYLSNYATATGLAEDTEYTYVVGSDEGGWSAPHTFNTGSHGEDWSFVTISDAQIGVDAKIEEQTEQWNKTINKAIGDVPDSQLIWSLGDQIEGWGAPLAQYDGFFSPDVIRQVPLSAIPGNHEGYPSAIAFGDYDEHFINPNQAPDLRNSWFERNNVLFINLDSNASQEDDIERHKRFLKDTIDNRGAFNDWVIVGMHHSLYSQATHYTDTDVGRLRDGLADTFSELGVDVVLSGHDHIYTRTHLMNGNQPVSEGLGKRNDKLSPNDNEVLYLTTTSAGGGKFYDFQDVNGEKQPNARMEHVPQELVHDSTAYWRQDYTPDYLRVDVTGEELRLTTYDEPTGALVDRVTLENRDRALVDPREEQPEPTEEPSAEPSEKPTTEPGEPEESTEPSKPSEPAKPSKEPNKEGSSGSSNGQLR